MEGQHIAKFKKKAVEENRTIAYQDEAAVCLMPVIGPTYAKRGKTPVLPVNDSKRYKHLSISAFMAEDGGLLYEVKEDSFKGADIARQLGEYYGGGKRKKHIVIWDNASIHKCQEVKDHLGGDEKLGRVWLANVPPYSPELNPVEHLWAYLKGTALSGIVCKCLKELKILVINKMEEIKKNKNLIMSFFKCKKVGFI
jgi:transposase